MASDLDKARTQFLASPSSLPKHKDIQGAQSVLPLPVAKLLDIHSEFFLSSPNIWPLKKIPTPLFHHQKGRLKTQLAYCSIQELMKHKANSSFLWRVPFSPGLYRIYVC